MSVNLLNIVLNIPVFLLHRRGQQNKSLSTTVHTDSVTYWNRSLGRSGGVSHRWR